jgi:hypothetical protein
MCIALSNNKLKVHASFILAGLLTGCTTATPSPPQKIEIIGQRDAAILLEFAGPERRLTATLSTDKPEGPWSEYTLELDVAGGAVGSLSVVGPTHGDVTGGGWIVDMNTVIVEDGVEHIRNPIMKINGKETDIIKAWRRLARYDKRFVIKERPRKQS